MSTKTRRGSAIANARKEKETKPEEPVEELEEDDDGPPPVLERESSCGENDDAADREMKEAEAMAAQIAQRASEDEFEENAMKNGCENLLQALSHVFSAEDSSPPGRKRRVSPQSDASKNVSNSGSTTRGLVPKALLLNKTVRPAQTPSTSTSSPSTRFTSLRHLSSAPGTYTTSSGSTTGNRKYGVPPPIPRSLRNIISSNNSPAVGVGSNTSSGPARLLENRKRQMEKEPNGATSKRPSLVAYNGGRAGENFRKVPSSAGSSASSATSTSSSTTAFDVQSMLRDQSPVRMQVSFGGDHETASSIQEALELVILQKETIGSIAKESSNHSILLGSMILNGLNTLYTRNPEEYNSFSADLFSLITKYSLH